MQKHLFSMRCSYYIPILFLILSLFSSPSLTSQISPDFDNNESEPLSQDQVNTGYLRLNYVLAMTNATFSGRWIQSSNTELGTGNGIITIETALDKNVLYANITVYDKIQKDVFAQFYFAKEKDGTKIGGIAKRYMRDDSGELLDKINLAKECGPADIEITLFSLTTGQELVLPDNQTSQLAPNEIGIMLHLSNEQCDLNVLSTILTSNQPVLDSQIWPYTITMCAIAVMQCVVCHRIQKYFINNPANAIKTSPWTIVLLQTFDLYIAINNATSSFATVAIFLLVVAPYVILSIYFEMKLILEMFVIQTKKYTYYQRIKLFRIKFIEAIISLTAVCGISLTMLPELAIFAVAGSLIPQIIETYTSNKKARRYLWSFLNLFLPKIAFIAYVQFYEGALTDQIFSTLVIAIAAGLLALQVVLLLIQSKYPRFIRNPESPYRCSKINESIHTETTCSICLYTLKEKPVDTQEPLLPSQQPDSEQTNSEVAITLCNHEFHEACLKGWLSNKLTCPYCRNELPPLVEEDA